MDRWNDADELFSLTTEGLLCQHRERVATLIDLKYHLLDAIHRKEEKMLDLELDLFYELCLRNVRDEYEDIAHLYDKGINKFGVRRDQQLIFNSHYILLEYGKQKFTEKKKLAAT